MTLLRNTKIEFNDSPSLDAFSRARVSEVTTLADYKQTFDNLPLFIDQVQGGSAASNYNAGEASTTLTTAVDGDYAIAQSKQRFQYQSGKSELFFATFYNFEPETNITKRIGYFSTSNVAPYTSELDGIFLESSSGVVGLRIYRFGINIFSVNQSSFNLDKLDGTGISGIIVDWSKNQILVFDFQWLGVGRIRFGLDIGGLIIYFHECNNANINTKIYMLNSNQPIRYEVRQNGVGIGSFTYLCSSVNSEGSINRIGLPGAIKSGSSSIQLNTSGTRYSFLGIRLKSDHLSAVIDIINAFVLSTTNDNFIAEIYLNPTTSGTFTYSDVNDYSIQFAVGGNSNVATGGVLLRSLVTADNSTIELDLGGAVKLGSTINGDRDELVLCITPLGANCQLYATLNWLEF